MTCRSQTIEISDFRLFRQSYRQSRQISDWMLNLEYELSRHHTSSIEPLNVESTAEPGEWKLLVKNKNFLEEMYANGKQVNLPRHLTKTKKFYSSWRSHKSSRTPSTSNVAKNAVSPYNATLGWIRSMFGGRQSCGQQWLVRCASR